MFFVVCVGECIFSFLSIFFFLLYSSFEHSITGKARGGKGGGGEISFFCWLCRL